jgi:FkbM family methyltransferase
LKVAYSQDGYEPEMRTVLQAVLRRGDTFVDLGANEGYFSVCAAALVGQGGRVIAIEPQYRLHPVIVKNAALNGLTNIDLVTSCIGGERGFVEFSFSSSTNTGASGLVSMAKYSLPEYTVICEALEPVLVRCGVNFARLLKIDIEGGEFPAILGSRDLLERQIFDYIALELHPDQISALGGSVEEIMGVLTSSGYSRCEEFPGLVLKSARCSD